MKMIFQDIPRISSRLGAVLSAGSPSHPSKGESRRPLQRWRSTSLAADVAEVLGSERLVNLESFSLVESGKATLLVDLNLEKATLLVNFEVK